MKCGCKKTHCTNKICKCRKAGSTCSDDCSCSKETCQNRQDEELQEPEEVHESAVSWEEVLKHGEEMQELLSNLSRTSKMVPKRLEKMITKQRGDFDEMKALLENMNGLAINNKNTEQLTEAEWKTFEENLVQCGFCERKFHPDRIAKHENVCQRRTFTVGAMAQSKD